MTGPVAASIVVAAALVLGVVFVEGLRWVLRPEARRLRKIRKIRKIGGR